MGMLLVLVSALIVFIAPPGYTLLSTYREAQMVHTQLEAEQQRHKKLKNELQRWDDTQYVETQARQRLGYVKPGQTRYHVVDPGKKYLEKQAAQLDDTPARPWFLQIQETIKNAGENTDTSKDTK